jgi:hypothetical protein
VHLGAVESASAKYERVNDKAGRANNVPRSANNNPGGTLIHRKALWENDIFFGNIAGLSANHSYYLSFNTF